MDLSVQLRQATTDVHQRIEALPLAQAMVCARVDREQYIRLLGEMCFVHETLEQELAARPELHDVFRTSMIRLPALRGDLSALGAEPPAAPLPETEALIEDFRRWAKLTPTALLGCLYILEGSRMGSMMLVRPLSQALHVTVTPGHGLDYHMDGIDERPRTWQKFRAALLAVPSSPEQDAQIVYAAVRTMTGLHDIYAAVGQPKDQPIATPFTMHAMDLNSAIFAGKEAPL